MIDSRGGGPAFPCEVGHGPEQNMHQNGPSTVMQYGMSFRDYLACSASQGMWAAFKRWPADGDFEKVADKAYLAADAMLARSKK